MLELSSKGGGGGGSGSMELSSLKYWKLKADGEEDEKRLGSCEKGVWLLLLLVWLVLLMMWPLL